MKWNRVQNKTQLHLFFSSSATKKQKISDEQLNLSVTSTETEEIASSDAFNLLGAIDSN